MPGSHIGKIIHVIHFLGAKRKGRRILDHISPCAVILHQRFRRKGICISVLDGKAVPIGCFTVPDLFKRRKKYRIVGSITGFAFINSSRYVGDLFHRDAAVQRIRDFNNRMFSHSVRDQIRPGIKKHTSFYPVLPVIIVSQPS